MSGEGGHVPGTGQPSPGWGSASDPAAYPATQPLPQQLPDPGTGPVVALDGPPPEPPTSDWQVGLVSALALVVAGALVFLLLAAFGAFDGDETEPVDTIDDPQPVPASATGQVPAIAQTVFRCPDGSMGAPAADDPNCVVAASTELVDAIEVEQTTYRCPAGASGSPNEARPECAATSSGAVPAIASTTLQCPQGSTGTPTPSNPVCRAANQQLQVPVEVVTVRECSAASVLDDAVDPALCVSTVSEQQEVPAADAAECPDGTTPDPADAPTECLLDADEDFACPEPTMAGGVVTCFGDLVGTVDAGTPCPAGSAPDPSRSSVDVDAEDCYETNPACPRLDAAAVEYRAEGGRCVGTIIVAPIVTLACPADVDAPDARVTGDRCQFSVEREVRVPAASTTEYRCPEGARGQGGSPDAICVVDRDVEVAALAITTYSCRAGSTGSPTAESPTCTSMTTETVPAIVETETVFECPEGTVGEPTPDDPACARTTGAVTVPASIVTEFSCPAGAIGAPTVTDPFCELAEPE